MTDAIASADVQFVAALPAIRQSARFLLRRRRWHRDELLDEAVACAWRAWRGLVLRGRNPVLVGVTGIARWAVRHALKGRRIGHRGGGRGAMDVFHPRAQRLRSFLVVSLDPDADAAPGPASWKDGLVADRRVTPADEACFRLDFEAWLASLPERRHRTALLLAQGHGTLEVARHVGLSPAAVSQARSRLARSWSEFQGEPHPVYYLRSRGSSR
jgi:hypothetical protein